MRFIETKKLSDYVAGIGGFLEEDVCRDFSARLSSLGSISLREVSIESDRAFLAEVSSVLNVIASIIHHPHLSNKHEEVIIRIEQAQQLSREDFLDTAKDSKLWKEHGIRMIPEEVHYHQYIDELRIYENRFIGFLVNLIDRELAKYSSFYLLRIPTLSSLRESLDPSDVGAMIVTIDRLRRKTQFIKSTRFYKEVTQGKPISPKIQPTNILLKDRLYRYCFRFYRDLARYEDSNAARRDLCAYYTVLLFGALDRAGFVPTFSDGAQYRFENKDFTLLVERLANGAMTLTVDPHIEGVAPAKHWLGFRIETELEEGEHPQRDSALYEGEELLSLWELSYAEGETPTVAQVGTEEELITHWLEEKITKIFIDPAVYRKYCPICGRRSPEFSQDTYTCADCSSRYLFEGDATDSRAWFRKIRKKGIS